MYQFILTHFTLTERIVSIRNKYSYKAKATNRLLTCKALTPPSSPVPLPKGMRGTTASLQSFDTPLTCSTDSANTTTSGREILFHKCRIF